MYKIYVFSEKIEYPELQKFNGKLYTLYMYEIVGFAEKLYVQNCRNSTGNSVHYMYGMFGFAKILNTQNFINSPGNSVQYICKECLDLQKN